MKFLVIIGPMLGGLGSLVCLCLMLMGLGYLISGKSPHGKAVHGKGSRKIGLAYLGQGVVAFAIWAALFSAFEWGRSPGSTDEMLARSLGQGVAALLVFGGAFIFARKYAKDQVAAAELDEFLEEPPATSTQPQE